MHTILKETHCNLLQTEHGQIQESPYEAAQC